MQDNNTILVVLAVFTGILALAVLMQSILFFLMYKSIRQLTVQIDGLSKDLLRHVGRVTAKVEDALATITSVADMVRPVVEKLNESADVVHGRILDLNEFLGETIEKARLEITTLQDAVHDTVQRAQEVIGVVKNNLLAPITQISAVIQGVRMAMDMLFRKRKKPVPQSSVEDSLLL